MSALTSFDDLASLLDRDKTKHVIDRQHQVIEIPTDAPPLPGNLYLRWEKQVPFVQLIHAVLLDVPSARVLDIERAITVLNNAIALPGFGFDEDSRRLYYRIVVPVFPPQGIEAEVLQRLVEGCVRTARQYQTAFMAVVAGRSGGDIVEIVASARR